MTQITQERKVTAPPQQPQPLTADKPAGLPCPNSSASFWHSEPNTLLLGHRTTSELPQEADIVIVGSGITGASIARYLAEDERTAGQLIVMLEAREICWGATGRNGGHCQPLLFESSADVAAFEVKNVQAVKAYIAQHSVPCEWRDTTGCRTFWDDKLFEEAQSRVQELVKANAELGKLVTVSSEKEVLKEHRVKPDASGITLTQGAGQLWPYKYVTFIVEKLVKEGKLNVQTQTPLLEINAGSNDEQILRTSRGDVRAKKVVLATNGYTSHVLHEFSGVIVPVRCEMSALHPPKGSTLLPNSYGMVGYSGGNPEHDDYLVQRPFQEIHGTSGQRYGGHLMFGGGRSYAKYNTLGETDDDIVDPGEADYLRRVLPMMLELGNHEDGTELIASHQWTGIKGNSRDSMPWVGKVPARNGMWLCAGYTGHGMPNATLCGKAVVEMMLGKDQETICKTLVSNGDLPQSYVLTPGRLEAAKRLPTVAEQEKMQMQRYT